MGSLSFFFVSFFSILSLANLAGVSNSRVEVPGKYPWLPLLGGGEEEGGLCLPDWARHRDRDQALPRCAERHRQATHRQHQHPVRRQLRHPLCHLPVQGWRSSWPGGCPRSREAGEARQQDGGATLAPAALAPPALAPA